MKHSDFQIGKEFFTGSGKWRCTDVGTRIIVAISLEPHAIVKSSGSGEEREITNDPSWFNGPPYAIVERVFDEDSIAGCHENADAASKSIR